MIRFQQSQALTSHFESFWSIVTKWCFSEFIFTENPSSKTILFQELSMNTNPFYQDRMSKKLWLFEISRNDWRKSQIDQEYKPPSLLTTILLFSLLIGKDFTKKKIREIHEKLIRARKKRQKIMMLKKNLSIKTYDMVKLRRTNVDLGKKIRQKFSPRGKTFLSFPIKICRWSWELKKAWQIIPMAVTIYILRNF